MSTVRSCPVEKSTLPAALAAPAAAPSKVTLFRYWLSALAPMRSCRVAKGTTTV